MKEFLFLIWCSMSYAQTVRLCLCTTVAMARFLKGTPVRAIMVRILRCGQTALVKGAPAIGNRNGIECRRNTFPIRTTMGHRALVLQPEAALVGCEQLVAAETHCAGVIWMQIRSAAWTLVQLLSLVAEESFSIDAVAPWRGKEPLTGGLVAQWLRMEFTGLSFRDSFNRKSSIFTFPKQRGDPRLRM